MTSDGVEIALHNFCDWLAEGRRAEVSAPMPRVLKYCIFLIYYFTLCDFIIKFLPLPLAVFLRYLPEAVLYIIALAQIGRGRRVIDFPLLWPLCACAAGMVISAALNSVSIIAALEDFRIFYRFAAFTFIAWKIDVKPAAVVRVMKAFIGLTVIQLGVGALEMIGGDPVQTFFAPVINLLSGNAGFSGNLTFGESGWIFGTLQDYNAFGFFMVMSCAIALGVYSITRARRYMGLAIACAIFVVLSFSRHSLLSLAVAMLCFYAMSGKKLLLKRILKGTVIAVIALVVVVEVARVANPELEGRLATLVSPQTLTTHSAANIRFAIIAALPPRFLRAYPLFGQGPLNVPKYGDERDVYLAPPLKAAPDLPGLFTFFLGDVVWVMILGFYGLVGLGGFFYIFWRIAKSANKIREDSNPARIALAQVYLSIMSAVIVSGFFSLEIVSRDCIPIFWLLAGMTLSLAATLAAENNGGTPRTADL